MTKSLVLPFGRDKLLKYLPKHANIAEVGVYKGKFSRKILWGTKPKSLALIDAWDLDVIGGHIPNIETHEANTFSSYANSLPKKLKIYSPFTKIVSHQSYSVPAANKFKDGELNWVYIDADHSYEGVKNDLEAWAPKVDRDGLILGHDFTSQECAVKANFGVIQAVKDFIAENDFVLVFLTTDYFPTFCIARKESEMAKQTLSKIFKKEKFLLELDSTTIFNVQHKRYSRKGSKTGLISTY